MLQRFIRSHNYCDTNYTTMFKPRGELVNQWLTVVPTRSSPVGKQNGNKITIGKKISFWKWMQSQRQRVSKKESGKVKIWSFHCRVLMKTFGKYWDDVINCWQRRLYLTTSRPFEDVSKIILGNVCVYKKRKFSLYSQFFLPVSKLEKVKETIFCKDGRSPCGKGL